MFKANLLRNGPTEAMPLSPFNLACGLPSTHLPLPHGCCCSYRTNLPRTWLEGTPLEGNLKWLHKQGDCGKCTWFRTLRFIIRVPRLSCKLWKVEWTVEMQYLPKLDDTEKIKFYLDTSIMVQRKTETSALAPGQAIQNKRIISYPNTCQQGPEMKLKIMKNRKWSMYLGYKRRSIAPDVPPPGTQAPRSLQALVLALLNACWSHGRIAGQWSHLLTCELQTHAGGRIHLFQSRTLPNVYERFLSAILQLVTWLTLVTALKCSHVIKQLVMWPSHLNLLPIVQKDHLRICPPNVLDVHICTGKMLRLQGTNVWVH